MGKEIIINLEDFLDQMWTVPAIIVVLATFFYPLLVAVVWSPALLLLGWLFGVKERSVAECDRCGAPLPDGGYIIGEGGPNVCRECVVWAITEWARING